MTPIKSVFFAAAILAAAACQGGNAAPSGQSQQGAANPGDPSAAAQTIFSQRCAACHGAEGKGDGPGGAALDPKPRNFHDPAWQSSVTDEQIEKAIREGGAAIGKSAAMPPNPDLVAKPEIIAALRAKVRAFGK